ncbi:TPA: SGNH/GDSL hydrolase family protein [Photobacterium damselae]
MSDSNNYFQLVAEFQQNINWLNQVLLGSDEVTITIGGVAKPSVSKAIKDHFSAMNSMVQGRLQFQTKSEMVAAGAPPKGELAEVWNDPVESFNGVYGWNGAWIKSVYGTVQADSIGHVQLKGDYLSSPVLVGDENLASVTQDGYHYCASGHTVSDLPDNFPADTGFVIYVSDVVNGSDRFKYQKVYLWNNPRHFWFRQLDSQLQTGTWNDGYKIDVSSQVDDKSIDIDKFGNFLLTRENLPFGVDLDQVETDGYHYGGPDGNYTNTPSGYDGRSSFIFYQSSTSYKGTRFKLQYFYLFNDISKVWIRRSDTTTPTDWVDLYQLHNDQFNNVILQRSHLSQNFMSNGVLKNSDIATLNIDGVFWISSANSYLGLPEGWKSGWSGILFINDTSGSKRFIHQLLVRYGTPQDRWERTLDLDSADVAEWVQINKAGARDSLEEHFLRNEVVYEGDFNALVKDGTYTVVNGPNWQNYPDTNDSLLLFNVFSDSDWLLQRAVSLKDHKKEWTRLIRVGNDPNAFPDWYLVGGEDFQNPHHGKRIAYFGDSIVEGGTIPEQLAEILGATVYKLGFGGCRMAYHDNQLYNTMSMCEMSGNIKSGDFTTLIEGAESLFLDKGDDNRSQAALVRDLDWSKVDIVVIAFGTNDFAAGVPIGGHDDLGTSTFYGAINKVTDDLLSTHPQLKLVFLTPIFRSRIISGDGKNSDDNPNSNGNYLIEYVDAIKERSGVHKVVSKDMYRSSNISKLTSAYYLADGLHPTADGYTHLAQKVAGLIRSEF